MLPNGLLQAVDTLADRLDVKASQLIHNQTTNICENFMSIHCKMDGGKYFNRVISTRSMAAALRVQYGPDWLAHIWKQLFQSECDITNIFANKRKRKLTLDNGRKVLQKYKRQRVITKTGQSQSTDSSYGNTTVQPDISSSELDQVCREFVACLAVNEQEQQQLISRTVLQATDPTGEWYRQRSVRATASHFGEICKRKAEYGPLTKRLIYTTTKETAQLRYGHIMEPVAQRAYLEHLKPIHPDAAVSETGLHVDLKVPSASL